MHPQVWLHDTLGFNHQASVSIRTAWALVHYKQPPDLYGWLKKGSFLDHAVCPFLVIRRALSIVITQKLWLMEKLATISSIASYYSRGKVYTRGSHIIMWSRSEVTEVAFSELVTWPHPTVRVPRGAILLCAQTVKSQKCLLLRPMIITCPQIDPKLTQSL